MDLDSENGRPKGMLDMNDISRKAIRADVEKWDEQSMRAHGEQSMRAYSMRQSQEIRHLMACAAWHSLWEDGCLNAAPAV